jgi:hypothetical protein
MPSREYKIVLDWMKANGDLPRNLVIRLSAHMVNAAAPQYGLPTSTVHTAVSPSSPFKVLNSNPIPADTRICPAPKQDGKCGNCRTCWNPKVANVSYHIH